MKCKDSKQTTAFVINYKKGNVKFKPKLRNKKTMSLKEFSIIVLGIDPFSVEVVAMYVGKLGFDTYNKGRYEINIIKKTKNGIKGILKDNEK